MCRIIRSTTIFVCIFIAIAAPVIAGQVTVCQCNIDTAGTLVNSQTGNLTRHDFAVWVSQQTINPPISVIGMEEIATTAQCDIIASELASATHYNWTYYFNWMGRKVGDSGEAVFWRTDLIEARSPDWFLGNTIVGHLDNGYDIKFMCQLLTAKGVDEAFGVISGKLVWDEAVLNGHYVTETDRQAEAVKLKTWIRNGETGSPAMSAYPDAVRIITTDLNSPRSTLTWNEMNLEYDDPGRGYTVQSASTTPTKRYDYIWWDYDGNSTKQTGGFVQNTNWVSSYFGSDHRAVYGTINTHWIDLLPPSATLTCPADGAAVSGSPVALSASASDASGIQKIDFSVDGAVVGLSASAPYQYNWYPQSVKGFHTITATAYDNSPRHYSTVSPEAVVWYDPAGSPASVANAKLIAAGNTKAILPDKVITAIYGNACYVEDLDRTSGIKVSAMGAGFTVGTKVTITGVMKSDVSSGERYLDASSVRNVGAAPSQIEPVAMRNSAVGGAPFGSYVPGVYGAAGVNNTGLLVSVWGRVTASAGTSFFYIDDSSGLDDGNGYAGGGVSYKGLRVDITEFPNGWTAPAVGSYVKVTGISSVINIGGKLRPRVIARSTDEIQVVL